MKFGKIVKALSLALVLATILALSACGSTTSGTSSKTASVKKSLKFAYMSPSLANPFWKTVANGVEQGAAAAGVTVKIYDSNNSANTEMANAQDIITQQYDGIIFTPTDSNAAPSVLNAAQQANIPVVLVNVGTFKGQYVSLIDAAEKQGGLSVGEFLAKQLKSQGKSTDTIINEITISLARTNGLLRSGGFQQGLTDDGYSISYIKQCELYTRDESYKFTQDMLTAYPNLTALFCNFDESALGAAKAIKDAGKSGKITLIGYDGSDESIAALKRGEIQAICLQEGAKQGFIAPQTLVDYLNGIKPKKEIQIPTLLVTKDNVDANMAMIKKDVFGE